MLERVADACGAPFRGKSSALPRRVDEPPHLGIVRPKSVVREPDAPDRSPVCLSSAAQRPKPCLSSDGDDARAPPRPPRS
jgi:hypothetical protein